MTNREKYNQAFIEVFGVEESALGANFDKDSVDGRRLSDFLLNIRYSFK